MAICQIMIQDFMYGWGRIWEDGTRMYGIDDLKTGVQYCEDLINFEKLEKEPFHGYDLRAFIEWAKGKIEEIRRENTQLRDCYGKDFERERINH